jgi:hypothetical protein
MLTADTGARWKATFRRKNGQIDSFLMVAL